MKTKTLIIFELFVLAIISSVLSQPPLGFVQSPNINFFMSQPAKKYEIKAYLKTGQIIQDETYFRSTIFSGKVYIKINDMEYFPSETDSVLVNNFTGLSYKNDWIFPVLQGKITCFKKIPERTQGDYFYLKKVHDSICEYSHRNIANLVKDNSSVYTRMQKRKYLNFISYGIVTAGVTLLIIGASIDSKKQQYDYVNKEYVYTRANWYWPEILISSGYGAIGTGIYMWFDTKNYYIEALKEYNE